MNVKCIQVQTPYVMELNTAPLMKKKINGVYIAE